MNRSGMEKVASMLTVIAVVTVLAGCYGSAYDVLIEGPKIGYIKDVPIPENFSPNEKESRTEILADSNFRDIDYVFNGKAHKMATKRFYEKQMPLYRWTPISSGITQGRIVMKYEKDGEDCVVGLEESDFLGGTKLSISIKSKRRK